VEIDCEEAAAMNQTLLGHATHPECWAGDRQPGW